MTRAPRLASAVLCVAMPILGACADRAPEAALVIVVDTLRADHLGLYGAMRATSPRLDRWARRGLVFERAYATSPWTLPSVASVLTGHLPSRHGAGRKVPGQSRTTFSPIVADLPTVAEVLGRAGLRTAAIVNNPFLHDRFGVGRGFATWDYVAGNRRTIRRAGRVMDSALTWLRDHRAERFLLLIHLFDPHLMYDAPPPYRDQFVGRATQRSERDVVHRDVRRALAHGEDVDFVFLEAAYDEEIAFVDAQLDRLFTALGELRLDRRVLVVLTADHGEEFGEHGGFEHGHTTFDEVARVPLVLWGPGVRPGRRPQAVSLLDIPPTLYAALGVPAPGSLPGRSLLGAATERPCLVVERSLYGPDEQALIRWPWKVVQEGRRAAVYNLDRDPTEERDLADSHPSLVGTLLAELASCTADQAGAAAPAELDPESERQLRSLGYLD